MHRQDGLRSYPYSYKAMASEWQRTLPPQFGNPAFLYPVEFPRDPAGAAPMAAAAEPPHIYEEVGPPDPPPTLPPSFRCWLPARFSHDAEFLHFAPDANASASSATLPPAAAACDGSFAEPHAWHGHCHRWTTTTLGSVGSGCCDGSSGVGQQVPGAQQQQQRPLPDPRVLSLSPSVSNGAFVMYPGLPLFPGHGACSCSTAAGTLPPAGSSGDRRAGSPGSQPVLLPHSVSGCGQCFERGQPCCPTDVRTGGNGSSVVSRTPAASSVTTGSMTASARKKRGFRSLSPFALLSKSSRDSTSSILRGSGCHRSCPQVGDLAWRRPCIIAGVITVAVLSAIALTIGLVIARAAAPPPAPYTPPTVRGTLQILGGKCSSYDASLAVRTSAKFVDCASSFVSQLDGMYRRSNASGFYNYSEVLQFRSGSLIVDFRLHLKQRASSSVVDGSSADDASDVQWLAAVLRSAAGGSDKVFVSIYAINVSSISLQIEASTAESGQPASLADPQHETLPVTEPWAGMGSSTQQPSLPPYVIPPQSGVCTPVTAPLCQRMPWNVSGTTVPNFVGSTQEASEAQLLVLSLLLQRCYSHFDVFVCSVYAPKCGRDGVRLPPCRRMCQDALSGCMAWMEAIHTTVPVDCNLFPNSSDPQVCVDHLVPVSTCPMGTFTCHNSVCIAQRNRCDGVPDCSDRSDEVGCANYKCTADQFTCANGLCRPLLWVCDGRNDCGDDSDERNCKPDGPCRANMFHCKNNGTDVWDPNSVCIRSSFLCDGTRDCSDGTDEDPQLCRGRVTS